MAVAMTKFTACKMTPEIPVVRNPETKMGVVQGIDTPEVGGTQPSAITT